MGKSNKPFNSNDNKIQEESSDDDVENQNEINRSQSINNSPRTPNTPNRATVPYTQINQTLQLSDVFLLLFLGIYFMNMRTSIDIVDMPKNSLASSEGQNSKSMEFDPVHKIIIVDEVDHNEMEWNQQTVVKEIDDANVSALLAIESIPFSSTLQITLNHDEICNMKVEDEGPQSTPYTCLVEELPKESELRTGGIDSNPSEGLLKIETSNDNQQIQTMSSMDLTDNDSPDARASPLEAADFEPRSMDPLDTINGQHPTTEINNKDANSDEENQMDESQLENDIGRSRPTGENLVQNNQPSVSEEQAQSSDESSDSALQVQRVGDEKNEDVHPSSSSELRKMVNPSNEEPLQHLF